MATNVMFKRGLQKDLPKTTGIIDGAFYLTTDTNRLYIGGQSELSLLNQTVQFVENVSSLPSDPEINDFYYCKEENILAIWIGGTQWIQINKDTNDYVKIEKIEQGERQKEDDSLVYPLTISQVKVDKNAKETKLDDIEFQIVISKSDLEEVIFKPANVGLVREVENNKATIKTDGDGSDSNTTVTIAGGDNVSITSEESDIIKISAQDTTYDLLTKTNSTEGILSLKDIDGVEDKIKFLAGRDLVVSSDDKNNIIYEHKTITTTPSGRSDTNLNFGDSITVIEDMTVENGHVTEIKTAEIQIPTPEDIHIEEIVNDKDDQGNVVPDWKVKIKETLGKTFDIDFSEDAKQLKADLQNEISDKLAAANTALVYKGGIASVNNLPTENVEIGDVYLLTVEDTVNNYKKGDLFIATVKAEGTHKEGVIDPGSIEWTYVPSGDELNTDTHFKGDVTINAGENKVTFEVVAAADAAGKVVTVEDNEALVIKGGTDIVISSDSGAKISHSTYGTPESTTNTTESNTTFTAITGITTRNGHITEIEKETFNILEYDLIGTGNKIILKDSVNGVIDTSVEVAGDNWIETTVANNKLDIKHKNTSGSGKTVDTANTSTALSANGKFKIISKVAYDDAGHITDVTSQELTMPEDKNTEYDLFVSANGSSTAAAITTGTVANPYIVLKDGDGVVNPIQISSTSLSINGEKEKIAIDLVWGSF